MFGIAISTLRERWPALAGTFVATALGAALMISSIQILVEMESATDSGPQRFKAAPIVVTGSTTLNPNAIPDGRIPRRRALTDELAMRIALQPGVEKVVADRSFIVRVPGSEGEATGRPWASHDLAPYLLAEGKSPAAPGEVVATRGTPWARVGQTIDAVTSEGPSVLKVVGVAEPGPGLAAGIERSLFFSEEQAARLAPEIDAFGVWPAAALPEVTAGLADSPQYAVLAGDDRARVEPDVDGLAKAGAAALLGIMMMTICFVAVFVIGSTSSLSVALRRRELGLLRAIGATPAQTRRLVLREATLLALLAGVLGAGLSLIVTPALTDWLGDNGLAPAGMKLTPDPVAILFGALAVLPVALVGCYLTARRAGRLRPVEALRDAAVDHHVMTLTRWLIGIPCLAAAIAIPMAAGFSGDPEEQLPLTFLEAMLLITGLSMLAPTLTPRLAWMLMLPLTALRGAGATLIRTSARTSIRRTAALAAPVLLAVGLTASLASALDSLDATDRAVAQSRIAPGVTAIVSPGASGLTEGDVDAFAELPGVRTGATLEADLVIKPGLNLGPLLTNGIDANGIDLALRAPVSRGSLDDLTGATMALSESSATKLGLDIGSVQPAWFPDGTARSMKVVAILDTGFDMTSIWVPRRLLAEHNGPTAATTIYSLPDSPAGSAEIDVVARERGLTIASGAGRKSPDPTDSSNMNGLALQAILGVALIYVAISLVTTAAITTAARRSELASLRLTGATPGQTARFVCAEALVATGIGGLLGIGVALIVKLGMERAVDAASGPAVVVMPWSLLFTVWGICSVLAGTAAVLSCLKTQRPAPHTLITG